MMYVVNRHLVVLLESKASRSHRELHPRAKARYVISCTCSQKRRADEHCIHTRAFMEDSVKPEQWRYITAEPMKAPDNAAASHNYTESATADDNPQEEGDTARVTTSRGGASRGEVSSTREPDDGGAPSSCRSGDTQ